MIKDARSLSPETQEEMRIRAVLAVEEEGLTAGEAARLVGVCRQTVQEWLAAFRAEGEEGLRRKRKGPAPGSQSLLEPWQQGVIVNMIKDHCPEQLKFPFYLWSREAVSELVWQRFGIRLAVRTMGDYLRNWGFTPQKPKHRAYEQDPEEVRRWRETKYPKIRRQAKKEGAEIHWGDETGIRSDHHAGRSYAPKGKTPVIPTTGQRYGVNVISSVSNRGTLRFMVFGKRFTAAVFIEFMTRLIKDADRRIYLIVDRHPVHRSRRVKQWVRANRSRIRLIPLPPYAPDANPDEFLNNDLKTNGMGRLRVGSRPDLVSKVRSWLWSTQKRPDIVRSYFHHPDVLYAAL